MSFIDASGRNQATTEPQPLNVVLDEWVREQIANLPPMNPATRDRIVAMLLNGGTR